MTSLIHILKKMLKWRHPSLRCELYFLIICSVTTRIIFIARGQYLLTPWSRVLLQKLTGFQLVKKFPAFYGTRRFITAAASARHTCPVCLLFSWRYNPLWLNFHSPVAGFSLLVFSRFLDHTQRRATVGRTPLDEWLVRRRDLYLTTHNTHNRQTSMPTVGFEPTISAGERPKPTP